MDAAVVRKAFAEGKSKTLLKPYIRYSKGGIIDTKDSIEALRKY
jgi:hypothetical protein